tara:strand:+ start:1039 stop:1374 length:336 start_codon:yes stop_codon:yes gene_type:complete
LGSRFVQTPACTFPLSQVLKAKKDAFDATEVSDAELRGFVEALAQQRKDMVDLESECLLEFSAALGADRTLMLPNMQRQLARRIRERMGTGRKGPSGPRQGQSARPARRNR